MRRRHSGRLAAPWESWSLAFRTNTPHTPKKGRTPPVPLVPRERATGAPHPHPAPPESPGASPTGTWRRDPSPRSATGASFRANVSLPNSKSFSQVPERQPGGLQPRPRKVIPAPQPHRPPALPRSPSSLSPAPPTARGCSEECCPRFGPGGQLESDTATKRRPRDGPVTGDGAPGECEGLRKSGYEASRRALDEAGEPWPLG